MTHSCGRKRWGQPPWWNDEVDKAWADRSLALTKWQKARKTHVTQPELILFKQT